jgi:hypothetical protein
MVAFEAWKFDVFWRTNLDMTAGIHNNNLDCNILGRVLV